MSPEATLNLRRLAASAASIAIGVGFYLVWKDQGHGLGERLFFHATNAAPFAAAALIWSNRLAAQLLARGAWWSMMLFGAIMSLAAPDVARPGAQVAVATGFALLAVGRSGLDGREGFAPVAFRGTLLVALVLAMADAGAFAWFGTGNALYAHTWSVLAMVPLMIAGVVGLLQLRTWGLILSLATNFTIAILAATRVLDLPGPLWQLFVGSAVVQLLVPLPMLIAMVRGRAPSADRFRVAKSIAPPVVIIAVALLSVYGAYVHHGRLLHM